MAGIGSAEGISDDPGQMKQGEVPDYFY